MADSAPTPEDFERAREDAAQHMSGDIDRWMASRQEYVGFGDGDDPNWENISRCARVLLAALTRLSAAERRVEAWGPIVRSVLVDIDLGECCLCRSVHCDEKCPAATLADDMKPDHMRFRGGRSWKRERRDK